MIAVGDIQWFARHEIRLAWRDWLAMMTAGRSVQLRRLAIGVAFVAVLIHLVAYAVVGRFADVSFSDDKTMLIVVTVSSALAWMLILSQAIESVTRAFYARADLDLILSSPAKLANLLVVRLIAIALTTTIIALALSIPFIDVLVFKGGERWLAAFGVVTAGGISAAAVAVMFTVVLFRLIGPKNTRFVAQILAAIIGAGFVIALQIAAIISYGTLSRFAVLTSDAVVSFAPAVDSPWWWPARALFGDPVALLALLAGSLVLLGLTVALVVPRLGEHIVSASTHTPSQVRLGAASLGVLGGRPFKKMSRRQALRRKEFVLLRRDPWLVSQTLMQLLYLIPPVVMLWRSFSDGSSALMILTPVVVMAAGQLAGGLAWLTISGEDAHDLVATLPLLRADVVYAKIEVVLVIIAMIVAPLLLGIALASATQAVVTAAGAMIASLSAAAIQLWFRVQARRNHFRRRQTASRLATFAEAFSSIGWAATAALALFIPLAAVITAALTLAMLAMVWKLSPDGPTKWLDRRYR